MERLAIRNSDGTVSQPMDLRWADALERLAAYEDTGLEPEEIKTALDGATREFMAYDDLGPIDHLRELVQAEQDGRLAVLPCKVGSNIYRLTEQGNIYCWQIVEAEIYEEEIVLKDDSDNDISLDDIGKTVFLTREEAEAALEKGESKDDVSD